MLTMLRTVFLGMKKIYKIISLCQTICFYQKCKTTPAGNADLDFFGMDDAALAERLQPA